MTLKEAIIEVDRLANKALKNGDHKNYQKCIELIADMVYTTLEAENLKEEA